MNKVATSDKPKIHDVIARIDSDEPTPQDVRLLRQLLTEDKEAWRIAGDIGKAVQDDLVKRIVGEGQVAGRESLRVGLDHMRKELEESASTPLEQLLVDQIVVSWLNLQWMQWNYQRQVGGDHKLLKFYDDRLKSAQLRHLRAMESLARVRKLGLAN